MRAPRLLALLAACAALFAQSASTDQNSASVAGVVVNAVTGEPVLRAHVMLFGFADGKQFRYGAMTTADGKFSVTGLPGASYGVSANRPGFVAGQSGSTGLTLKPGDHKDDVTLKLTPTGSIAGTVVNADGEPVENCNVTAESGRGGQVSQSDAQGRFRIGGLMPGKYRIRATPEEPLTPPEIRTDGTLEAHYSQTYYPSSLDEAGAARVSVEAGTEAAGNEIRLVRTPIVRVSGRVTGIPPGAENVALIAQRGRDSNQGFSVGLVRNTVWSGGAQVKKDGTFTLWRLAPGPYRLGAQWNSPTGQMSAAAPVDIVVGDSNIDGIELRMMPAADLTGQVEYESDDAKSAEPAEGAKPARRPKPQVQLQGIDGNNWAATGQVDAAGAFTLKNVPPGRYRVMSYGGSGYVKSLRLGTTEIAGHTVDLSNGAAGSALTIVISTQFGSVSGSVQTDEAATTGLQVLLYPISEELNSQMAWRTGAIGAGGSYSLDSVIPGTYKLAVIVQSDLGPILQGGDEWDAYAPVTETVTIGAGDKITQDLKILAK